MEEPRRKRNWEGTYEYTEPEHGDYGACYDGKVAEPEAK